MSASAPAKAAVTALRDLAQRVEDAETLDEVSELIGLFFNPDGGVLDHVTSVMWAAAGHGEANLGAFRDEDPAYTLWHRLAAAAEKLGDIRDDTGTTPRDILLVDPVIPMPAELQSAALAFSPALATVPVTSTKSGTSAQASVQPPPRRATSPGR